MIAEKIRQIRTEKRRLAKESGADWRYWTQSACAARAGITAASWNDMETGKHEPQIAKLRKAAAGLGVHIADLLSVGEK